MIGQFYIDGVDIPTTYGIYIAKYDGIFSFPEMKEPETNDWPEMDGIEVDLSDPKLSAVEFEINFGTISKNADVDGFLNLIIGGAFHDYNFTELGITKSLRLVDNKNNSGSILDLRLFSLTFSDDFPLSGYSYLEPVPWAFPEQGYKFDGVDLSQYGVAVLDGSDSNITQLPAVKKNLKIDSNIQNGVISDPVRIKLQSKDVKLNLLMRAKDKVDFIRNLNALLYDLTRPDERLFYFGKNEETYKCYYKAGGVDELSISPDFWYKFYITLVFTAYNIKRHIYFAKVSSKLVATDTPYLPNNGIALFTKIDAGIPISSVVTMSKSYSGGKIAINVSCELKEVVLNYSNGKLSI